MLRLRLGTTPRPSVALLAAVFLSGIALMSAANAEAARGLARLGGGVLDPRVLEGDAVVVFFASWSPRCRDIVVRVNDIEARWGDRVPVLLVDFQEEAAEVREFLAGQPVRVDVFLDTDGSLSKRFSITTLPGLLVLDDGSVAYRGHLPEDVDSILRTVVD